ncbi:MAG: PatB family C-S lyase [Treponema sp.]|jgi:cystathionine beta-lyase|nr:PatB family C-S lyase [Treponema sp.]
MNSDYNFYDIFDRTGTGSVKWEDLDKTEGKLPVIPLWVADMDFPSLPEISRALMNRAAHPAYGYTRIEPSYYEALREWYKTQYCSELATDDFILGAGTVSGLGTAVRTWSKPGDGVLLLTPVYRPFYDSILRNNRKTLELPLKAGKEGRYCFDADDLEQALEDAKARGLEVPLILFCSPHNPGGSVWTREELESLLGLAEKKGLIVAADEIHGDFVYAPKRFVSLSSFPEHASRTVVLSAPSKSFNLGGLHISHFITRDKGLKAALRKSLAAECGGGVDIFSITAATAAYRCGAGWLTALKAYIKANIEETVSRLNAEARGFRVFKPEGTYLVWADVSELIKKKNLKDDLELAQALEADGRVKVTPGSAFGPQGRGFIRINAACPGSMLAEALNRIAQWSRL